MESAQPNVAGERLGLREALLPPDTALAYRVNDASRVSGLGTIYKLIGEGKLCSVLVAGRRLIPADALRDLLRGAA